MLETILKFADMASFVMFIFYGVRLAIIRVLKDIFRYMTGNTIINK